MKVLLTGASGFIGRHLLRTLLNQHTVLPVVRKADFELESGFIVSGEINGRTDWSGLVDGQEVVIHLAARAHILNDTCVEPLAEFRSVNADGTLNLARQAAIAGVKRLVFLSSIGVNGNRSQKPFTERDTPEPYDPYSISKWEAEQGLKMITQQTGLEVVIIRSPLVYGPNAPGNWGNLVAWIRKGIPLPFGAIHNQRSLVSLDNLVDFIITCIDHPAAANQTFLVADGEDLSTTNLLRRLAHAMDKTVLLIPVPSKILEYTFSIFGKETVVQKLCRNLQIDISKARNVLGWNPPVSVDEGLRKVTSEKRKVKSWAIIRLFDIIFSLFGLIVVCPLLMMLIVIGFFDTGSPIFKQQRVGREKKTFTLVKFRTMTLGTASVASHLASASSITKFGHFLRRTKLDELPQLWNVLKGEMSLVGPRPCLFNQKELIQERVNRGVYQVRPGITGLAQVTGIDMSTPELLAKTDAKMIRQLSIKKYFMFILQTITGKGSGDRVKD